MKRKKLPLSAQVVIAVVLGTLLGALLGKQPVVFGLGTEQLGELGLLVIRLLKALAVPLVLFAVLDGLLTTNLSGKSGLKLLRICATNAAVALAIGLTLMNILRPGDASKDALAAVMSGGGQPTVKVLPADTLSPLAAVKSYVPESLVAPFAENSVIPVVLLALLAGSAMRRFQHTPGQATVTSFVRGMLQVLTQMLTWVVYTVPWAVFCIVAQVVGRAGVAVFGALLPFILVVLAGFTLHAFGYYLLVGWLVGRKRPGEFLRGGGEAILTGMGANSSLAAMPVTLRCLAERLNVSAASARLSACIGTNLNNDGITLYEAMAALFIAQALGMDLTLGQQASVVAAAIFAGVGIAGIPEAGLVMLPLVLGAAGLTPEVAAIAVSFLVPADWILARCRSAMNVMSDLLVAVLLDAGEPQPEKAPLTD